jgi:hypothetical protein
VGEFNLAAICIAGEEADKAQEKIRGLIELASKRERSTI